MYTGEPPALTTYPYRENITYVYRRKFLTRDVYRGNKSNTPTGLLHA
jgi:hypothetical protein